MRNTVVQHEDQVLLVFVCFWKWHKSKIKSQRKKITITKKIFQKKYSDPLRMLKTLVDLVHN